MTSHLTIAIDGPSGAGKSTYARSIAQKLNILYLDTGAMYRAIGYKALKCGLNTHDAKSLCQMLTQTELEVCYTQLGQRIYLDGQDITDDIRTQEIGRAGSDVSTVPQVREYLVEKQREIARGHQVIMDGRDIGTHVLPDASFKFYVTADSSERALRRMLELKEKGLPASFEEVHEQINKRDEQDMNRKASPLKQAEDAIFIDSTDMDVQQVVRIMLEHIHSGEAKERCTGF